MFAVTWKMSSPSAHRYNVTAQREHQICVAKMFEVVVLDNP